ncbi:hypothetical protein MHU86_6663 [Fragilaria crotonensis]|nr:hypothetical protein MHU86_6663 [Fragilaria crotonensis]
MKTLQVFYQCWLEVTKQGRYRDKWLSDETYFRALKAQFPTLDTVDFTRAIMNRAISKGGGMVLDDFSDSNTTGLFRRQATGICPLDKSEEKHLGILYYNSRRSSGAPTGWKEEFLVFAARYSN